MPSNKNKWVNVNPSTDYTIEKDTKSITSNHFYKDKSLFNKKSQNVENCYDMNNKNYKSKFAYLDNSREKRFENSTNARIMNSPYMQEEKSPKQPSKYYPMLNGSSKRPITTSTLIRPPSRHKTPNKALGLDTPLNYEKNKNLKQRPNTSKNVRINPNYNNKKRESYEGEDQIPINNFREEIEVQNANNNNEIISSDLINNEVEYDECLSNESQLIKNNEYVKREKSSNSKFSATAYDKFYKEGESYYDQKFNKTSYGSKMNFVENANNFKNKSRKSQSQNYEKNKVLYSSLNKDFLDLFATK
eukprot:Mrub_07335.p1 GENE.Mrub_07335~~Mrub_07335.p1  ORF type:complete len:303 (+),score=61.79 Mrub_07335:2-910(+)